LSFRRGAAARADIFWLDFLLAGFLTAGFLAAGLALRFTDF